MNLPIKIMMAEDQHLFSQGLVALLKEFPEIEVTGVAQNGKELLSLMKERTADIILLDIEMPVMDGQKTLEQIKRYYPNVKVLMLSFHGEEEYVNSFIIKGANGYLKKDDHIEVVIKAIKIVFQGNYYFQNKEHAKIMIGGLIKSAYKFFEGLKLTPTEIEILRMICEEKSTAEIALEMNLTEKAIEYHRANINERTGSKTPAGLIKFAIKNGIYPLN